MSMQSASIAELSARARDVFRQIVESYVETGSPIGSRTISKLSGLGLSAASIRNVMQDLEEMGLLASPHTSAGRIPTETGLRLFVDGMMQAAELSEAERQAIERQLHARPGRIEEALSETTARSEEHTSELQSLMRTSYAVSCLKKTTRQNTATREI